MQEWWTLQEYWSGWIHFPCKSLGGQREDYYRLNCVSQEMLALRVSECDLVGNRVFTGIITLKQRPLGVAPNPVLMKGKCGNRNRHRSNTYTHTESCEHEGRDQCQAQVSCWPASIRARRESWNWFSLQVQEETFSWLWFGTSSLHNCKNESLLFKPHGLVSFKALKIIYYLLIISLLPSQLFLG